jgi:hypothetical protein
MNSSSVEIANLSSKYCDNAYAILADQGKYRHYVAIDMKVFLLKHKTEKKRDFMVAKTTFPFSIFLQMICMGKTRRIPNRNKHSLCFGFVFKIIYGCENLIYFFAIPIAPLMTMDPKYTFRSLHFSSQILTPFFFF